MGHKERAIRKVPRIVAKRFRAIGTLDIGRASKLSWVVLRLYADFSDLSTPGLPGGVVSHLSYYP
jgi:hypothetical protein